MATRLTKVCNRFIEAGWLAALIIVPLYFNPSSSRIFEADKVALLRSIAVIMALAWLIKAGEAWVTRRGKANASAEGVSGEPASWRAGLRHPVVLAAALVLVSQVLASVSSILPALSLWGQYDRLQGVYTVAAYLVFFFSIVALLRTRAQVQHLVTAVLLASVPVALYGILQHFDVRLWRWTFDVVARVHSTMGNPIYLAAILSLAVPMTLYRLFETKRGGGSWLRLGVYLVVLVLQLLGILYTQSRGPLLGMAFGVLFGGLLWTLARRRWRWARGLLGAGALFTLLLVVVNLPNTPLSFVQDVPYLNRLARLANAEGSSVGRVLIWEAAIDLATEDPVRIAVGNGPETLRYVFYPHHTAEIGNLEGWNVVPDRMHNESFDVVISTGLIGLIVYLFLFTSIVYYAFRWIGVIASTKERNVFLTLWCAGAVVMIVGLRLVSQTWTFSGVALPLGLLGGAVFYLAGYAIAAPRRERADAASADPPPYLLLLILLFSAIIAHFVEINVGIAVAATRLYFWIFTALLVALGLYGAGQTEAPSEPASDPKQAARPAPRKSAASKRARKSKPGPKPPARPPTRLPEGLLAPILLAGLTLGTIAFSFFSSSLPPDAMGIVWGFVVAVWVLAGGLLAAEWVAAHKQRISLRMAMLYAVVAWLPALAFGLLKSLKAGDAFYHLVLYHLIVLGVLIALGLGLRRTERKGIRKTAPVSIGLGVVLSLMAAVFLYRTNVQIIQANLDYNVARAALQQKSYDLAIARYHDALARDPGQGRYQLELAQALISKAVYTQMSAAESDRLFRQAEEVLLQAMAENPFEPYNEAQLAEVYRIWAMVSPDETRQREARRRAVAYLEDALQHNAQNILFLRKWAELQEQTGDTLQALVHYRELLRWDSTNAELYVKVGDRYRTRGQWQEAAEMYEGALRHSKRRLPETHRFLAGMYQELGRTQKALQAGRRAVAIDPGTQANHMVLIEVYERAGRCDRALEQTRTALQRWPGDDDLKARAARLAEQCAGD